MLLAISGLLLHTVNVQASIVASLKPTSDVVDYAFDRESLVLEYEITNQGAESLSFLPWKTPLEQVVEDLFVVTDEDGVELPYTGVRGFLPSEYITDDMYMSLSVGHSLRATVDLTRSYKPQRDGLISIRPRQLNCTGCVPYASFDTVEVRVVNAAHLEGRFNSTIPDLLGNDFGRCNGNQQNAIRNAWNVGLTNYVPRMARCVQNAGGPSCNAFTTYMGAFNAGRYNTARTCTQRVQQFLPAARFDCDGPHCGNLWAYVHPDDRTNTIWLCQGFFDRPNEGGRTMVHEQTHFMHTCDTLDWVVGDAASRDLARTNPARAINNADNYAFFARFA